MGLFSCKKYSQFSKKVFQENQEMDNYTKIQQKKFTTYTNTATLKINTFPVWSNSTHLSEEKHNPTVFQFNFVFE